jgi:hypothetical protein
MDTTIAELSKFVAALSRGEGLSAASYAQMLKPQLHIVTATQFPNFAPEPPPERQRKDLYAGLVRLILGDTGVHYEWEYGDRAGKS